MNKDGFIEISKDINEYKFINIFLCTSKGNNHYKEGYLKGARDCYLRAAWIMEDARLKNEAEEKQRTSLLMKMRSNLAQVRL